MNVKKVGRRRHRAKQWAPCTPQENSALEDFGE